MMHGPINIKKTKVYVSSIIYKQFNISSFPKRFATVCEISLIYKHFYARMF